MLLIVVTIKETITRPFFGHLRFGTRRSSLGAYRSVTALRRRGLAQRHLARRLPGRYPVLGFRLREKLIEHDFLQ